MPLENLSTRVAILEERHAVDRRIDKFLLRICATILILKFLGIDGVSSIIKVFTVTAMTQGPHIASILATIATAGILGLLTLIHFTLNRGQL